MKPGDRVRLAEHVAWIDGESVGTIYVRMNWGNAVMVRRCPVTEVNRNKLLALTLTESDGRRPRTHESENAWLRHGRRMRYLASSNDDAITISTANGYDYCGVR
jgi:hypothetical protein